MVVESPTGPSFLVLLVSFAIGLPQLAWLSVIVTLWPILHRDTESEYAAEMKSLVYGAPVPEMGLLLSPLRRCPHLSLPACHGVLSAGLGMHDRRGPIRAPRRVFGASLRRRRQRGPSRQRPSRQS